jgi:hypothetical protein
MEEFVREQNIAEFRKQLQNETTEERRRLLRKLLAEELAKRPASFLE